MLTNSTERGTRAECQCGCAGTECGISWWRWVGLPNRLRLAISPANRFAIRVRRCNLLVMGSPPVKSSISPVFPGQIGDFPFVSSIKSGRLLCEACMLLDLFLSVRPSTAPETSPTTTEQLISNSWFPPIYSRFSFACHTDFVYVWQRMETVQFK